MFADYDTCIAAETDLMVVVEGLRSAQQLANCNQATAGDLWYRLDTLLAGNLSTHLQASRGWSARKANAAARKVIDTAHDCGENIRYCLALLDDGKL
jgi:hypothetical protein